MNYGSNIDWKALQEESLRRAIQAREAERQRQIFEAVYHPTLNRNPAGGAAAASGGNPNVNQNFPQTTQSSIFLYKSTDEFNFYFFVANYNTNTTSTPSSIGVNYNEFDPNQVFIVNEGGYVGDFIEQSNSNHHIIKIIDSGGNVLESLDITTSDIYIDYVPNGWIYIVDVDDNIYWWFDGNNLYKVPQSYFEGLSFWEVGSFEGSRSNNLGLGFVTVVDNGTTFALHFYILDGSGNINLVYSNEGEIGVDLLQIPFISPDSDYILTVSTVNPENGPLLSIEALDINGNEISSLDLSSEVYNSIDFADGFGSGKSYIIFINDEDIEQDSNLVVFNGSEFQSTVIGPQRSSNSNFIRSKWFYDEGNTITWSNTTKNENAFFVIADGSFNGNFLEVTEGQIISYIDGDFYFYDLSGKKIRAGQNYEVLSNDTAYFIIDEGDDLISVLTSGPNVGDLSKFELLPTGESRNLSFESVTYGSNLYTRFYEDGVGGTAILFNNTGATFSTLSYSSNNISFESSSDVIQLTDFDNKESFYATQVEGFTPTDFTGSASSITRYYTEENRKPSILIREGWFDSIYWFSDVGDPYSISDGGDDMYDTGNIIETNYTNQIPYTHVRMDDSTPFIDDYQATDISQFPMQSSIVSGASAEVRFGPTSAYFTNMYPGMFFLAVHDTDITTFRITGELGSDGSTVYGPTGEYEIVQNGATYSVYYKCTSDDGNDPSVNHIIITNTGLDSSTRNLPSPLLADSDLDEINNLTPDPARRIYYLLLAKSGGNCLTVEEIEDVASECLELINPTGVSGAYSIEDILEVINSNYENITGILGEHTNQRRVQILTTDGVNYGSVIYNDNFIQGNNFMIGREVDPVTALGTYRVYDFDFNLLYSFSEDSYAFNYEDYIVGERAMIKVSNKDFDGVYPTKIYLLSKTGYTTVDVDIFDNSSFISFNDIVWYID
jgi:hypothetical protein